MIDALEAMALQTSPDAAILSFLMHVNDVCCCRA